MRILAYCLAMLMVCLSATAGDKSDRWYVMKVRTHDKKIKNTGFCHIIQKVDKKANRVYYRFRFGTVDWSGRYGITSREVVCKADAHRTIEKMENIMYSSQYGREKGLAKVRWKGAPGKEVGTVRATMFYRGKSYPYPPEEPRKKHDQLLSGTTDMYVGALFVLPQQKMKVGKKYPMKFLSNNSLVFFQPTYICQGKVKVPGTKQMAYKLVLEKPMWSAIYQIYIDDNQRVVCFQYGPVPLAYPSSKREVERLFPELTTEVEKTRKSIDGEEDWNAKIYRLFKLLETNNQALVQLAVEELTKALTRKAKAITARLMSKKKYRHEMAVYLLNIASPTVLKSVVPDLVKIYHHPNLPRTRRAAVGKLLMKAGSNDKKLKERIERLLQELAVVKSLRTMADAQYKYWIMRKKTRRAPSGKIVPLFGTFTELEQTKMMDDVTVFEKKTGYHFALKIKANWTLFEIVATPKNPKKGMKRFFYGCDKNRLTYTQDGSEPTVKSKVYGK